MPANIQDVLAYEVKKEIADRYFGFRKLIEEDTLDLKDKIRQQRFILEKRISFDLIRLYVLLRDETLIETFLDQIGLHKKLFYDPYLAESETIRKRVFQGITPHGFTWQRRYKNMILDIYERLTVHVAQYCEKTKEMQELGDTIQEEITIFQRNNDLGSILGFLHSLGDKNALSTMQGGLETGIAAKLQQKLQIQTPNIAPPQKAILQPLHPLSEMKHHLKKIIHEAYTLHGATFREFFSQRQTTGRNEARREDGQS